MPKTGALDRKQVASLTGLAPITRQSGQWQGKTFIGRGRKSFRDALHRPALLAMQCNPDLKARYEHLRAAGKPPMPSLLSCASSSKWEMLWSKPIANGDQNQLDQDGYSALIFSAMFHSQPNRMPAELAISGM